jgi:site-specific DNA-methyltransferase (adenine-specific)
MSQLEIVDHVITDPPYSAHVHKSVRRGMSAHNGQFCERSDLGFASLSPELMADVAALSAKLSLRWIIMFSDSESSHLWRAAFESADMDYVRTGAWIKVGGAPQFTGDRPAVGFEAINIFHPPGRKKWNGGGKQGLWSCPIVVSRGGHNEVRVHTAQKPLKLMTALIEDFTSPGDVVLDPFMGSGTTLRAAKDTGRKAIGIELQEKYCEIAAKRMSQEVLSFPTEAA